MSVTIMLTISVFRPSKIWYFRFHHCFCVRNPLKSHYISNCRHENRSISDFREIGTPPYIVILVLTFCVRIITLILIWPSARCGYKWKVLENPLRKGSYKYTVTLSFTLCVRIVALISHAEFTFISYFRNLRSFPSIKRERQTRGKFPECTQDNKTTKQG